MQTQPGYFTVFGQNPDGKGKVECRFAIQHIEQIKAHAPESKFFEIQSAVEVLERPTLIYKGLERSGFEEGLCYIGVPRRFREGVEMPPPPKMIFLVCLTKDFKVFEWRWEREDAIKTGFPCDEKRRFTELKWKR